VISNATVLLLVRHGQTDANAHGLILGRADPPLNALGRRQARDVAAVTGTPARVISSPLHRATATAREFGVPVEIDERWIELDYGDLDGKIAADTSSGLWMRWERDLSFAPDHGESLAALGKRVRDACEDISDAAAQETVVVVTHVSPIKATIAWALGIPDLSARRMYVEDGSVSRIDFEPHGPVLRWFNRTVGRDG
jgi:broad specificity phosphatase PhoE